MGYRDDFYIKENIIGYTGSILFALPPTIYFYDCTRKFLGHITQLHEISANIGREKVFYAEDYLIFNSNEGDPAMQASIILGISKKNTTKSCFTMLKNYDTDLGEHNVMLEYWNSVIKHRSRSRLVSVNKSEDAVRTYLFDMIKNNPKLSELKPIRVRVAISK